MEHKQSVKTWPFPVQSIFHHLDVVFIVKDLALLSSHGFLTNSPLDSLGGTSEAGLS